ncbi:SbcC/MukB-like Walker B domain-containing protein [Pelagibacterium sediminicola]|uniref:SbcC/MukB-like Walker B domain-containing protein n=1 Tax=Pelagibacterium sediminicola TaxID=2248761 RepID=UPI001300B72B|nr:SbcC/MukB-like Walker B domain-containing protein [Pelagibacterium sediminicola]
MERLRELELADVPLFQGDVEDEHPLAAELKVVEAVLLDEEVDIEQYEDYRRYFAFELEITSLSSGRTVPWSERKGTASGGETQTPYYVALLSALSSIYYGGARSRIDGNASGLCLAAFDEAFSKLDEKVRFEMVKFCQELGLQLLICGPDGGRQSMERYAHTIVDVWRRGDESYARSDMIKQRTRDELAAIDPARLSREEIEVMMGEAAE